MLSKNLVPSSSETWVLGYDGGRVFPAGGGPGSPSRDAANWLSSRFSRSVETRRRYCWLRGWCSPSKCASSELQFGILREVVARERQGTLSVAESLPLCARIKGANREVSEGKS